MVDSFQFNVWWRLGYWECCWWNSSRGVWISDRFLGNVCHFDALCYPAGSGVPVFGWKKSETATTGGKTRVTMEKQKLIVIVGPTASGKTDVAIQVAKAMNGEIIAADSRTVYRGMNIGAAKPEGERVPAARLTPELVEEHGIHGARAALSLSSMMAEKPYMVDGVPHWGIDLVDPLDAFTVADFKAYAEEKISDITKRGKMPMLVGGTGLYVNAVVDNWTLTEVAPNEALRAELDGLTNEQLIERLGTQDPEAIETIDVANRRRLLRAIEIVESTGKTLAENQKKGPETYDVHLFGMYVDREVLNERIDARVDAMIAGGLVDEVRGLREQYGCDVNAMTGIGYRQICAFLEGYMRLRDAIDVLKRDTRHYAKRQMTWFKRDDRIIWVKNAEEILNQIPHKS